ncbi:LLM class F420-dependent oxidoreductase [Paractinoplanes deccanensis]|uniref:LLM class F420-dependent oxidoreductase n=1 Tax=Paractinoplanes deccanensis TaxID=113561 RepID=A0ABQ3XVM6_9ACTN|nr:TIGR03620 family F420-dependent LLM class oxidoreductase [Actinoplanes deccanensis]GID71722.1 LLM class F420-dependent oxidoreductase [Actinoplanes deccanensis]
MKQVGLWSMQFRGAARPQVRDAVAELEELGWDTLWLPGLDGTGALADVVALAGAAPRSTVVTGVLNIWGQTPQELSDRFRPYGERVRVGLGVGSRDGDPFAAMNKYLDELERPAWVLGALGPRMVDLAVARTSGWHPFLVTPSYVARERARAGNGPIIAPHQAVVLTSDPAEARAAARAEIGMFIGFPAYRNNLRRLGFTDDDLVPGGSDRLIDALVAHGSADDIARRVRDHLDAGADHVALHVLGSRSLPLAQWRELSFLAKSSF